MSSKNQKLRVICAFAALATLALAVSCRGFFVNPTLTGVSVGPSGLNLNVNQTFQMTATGTYDDGSQKTLTSGVVWSSSAPTTVSVGQTSGMVTGLQSGTATITASSGGCSACTGTASVSVVLSNVSSITVSPSSQSVSIGGTPVAFTATAAPGGDITQGATWNIVDSSNTNQNANFSIAYVAGSGEQFLPSSSATPGTYTIVVTYPGTTATGKATLIVSQ
jgi:Bacterial Ig-like domain (group 2)